MNIVNCTPMRIAMNYVNRNKIILLIITLITLISITSISAYLSLLTKNEQTMVGGFDGERAYRDVVSQMEFGPRTTGSTAHAQTVEYISHQLTAAGWTVHQQDVIVSGKEIKNLIATRRNRPIKDKADWIILGAHYDSRLMADRDPDEMRRSQPVPSANDGASGVAVLLELARVLPEDMDENVWLAFFDAEDNANISNWKGIMGSQAFVDSLIAEPDAVVIVDMIGDEDLNIFIERNSDISLVTSIWGIAASLGYSKYFIPLPKHGITDDHTPFLNEGISAVDIIDFDYAYWHSTQDTLDKVSAKSLQIVGEVVYTWITTRGQ